jgi:hypothetical protein
MQDPKVFSHQTSFWSRNNGMSDNNYRELIYALVLNIMAVMIQTYRFVQMHLMMLQRKEHISYIRPEAFMVAKTNTIFSAHQSSQLVKKYYCFMSFLTK